jgi:all-trans-retinol 13,14-reductase
VLGQFFVSFSSRSLIFLQPRTPIKNFYLTGQDIISAGVGGALFSGVVTASAMQGKNLVKMVYKAKT